MADGSKIGMIVLSAAGMLLVSNCDMAGRFAVRVWKQFDQEAIEVVARTSDDTLSTVARTSDDTLSTDEGHVGGGGAVPPTDPLPEVITQPGESGRATMAKALDDIRFRKARHDYEYSISVCQNCLAPFTLSDEEIGTLRRIVTETSVGMDVMLKALEVDTPTAIVHSEVRRDVERRLPDVVVQVSQRSERGKSYGASNARLRAKEYRTSGDQLLSRQTTYAVLSQAPDPAEAFKLTFRRDGSTPEVEQLVKLRTAYQRAGVTLVESKKELEELIRRRLPDTHVVVIAHSEGKKDGLRVLQFPKDPVFTTEGDLVSKWDSAGQVVTVLTCYGGQVGLKEPLRFADALPMVKAAEKLLAQGTSTGEVLRVEMMGTLRAQQDRRIITTGIWSVPVGGAVVHMRWETKRGEKEE